MDINSIQITNDSFALAVSGGVDSMMLLDIARLKCQPKQFVAAHFNHGIRPDAETAKDEAVVRDYCAAHDIRLELGSEQLGPDASEATARDARYAFLEEVRQKYNLDVIMTAHHKDDLVETAIINLLRGTSAKGLVSLASGEQLIRPLLDVTKAEILEYAQINNLKWHDDVSNQSNKYLRNHIRNNVIPSLKASHAYDELEEIIISHKPVQAEIGELIDQVSESIVDASDGRIVIERSAFILLDHVVASELIRKLFSAFDLGKAPSKGLIQKIVTFSKTAGKGAEMDVSKSARMKIDESAIVFTLD